MPHVSAADRDGTAARREVEVAPATNGTYAVARCRQRHRRNRLNMFICRCRAAPRWCTARYVRVTRLLPTGSL